MSNTGETAEISYCASILAKAFKDTEDDGTSFSDVHDALGKFLPSHQLSKVEVLATKYTELPLHVLERKINWLESHGVKPASLEASLNKISSLKPSPPLEDNGKSSEASSREQQSAITPAESPSYENKVENESPTEILNIKDDNSKLSAKSSKIEIYENSISQSKKEDECKPSAVKDSVVGETTATNMSCGLLRFAAKKNEPEDNHQFIEMKEITSLSHKDKIEALFEVNGDKDESNLLLEQPEVTTTKKKKNKKKKKKPKSVTQVTIESTQTSTIEETETTAEEKCDVPSSKSSRSARRRRLCLSRKKLESKPNSNDDIGSKEKDVIINIGDLLETGASEKQAIQGNEKTRKHGKNERKQKAIPRNTSITERTPLLFSETIRKNSKTEVRSTAAWKLDIESLLSLSYKKDTKKIENQSNYESDSERGGKVPWQVVDSTKSNINGRGDGFSKPAMSYPAKTTLLLDSAGGSIASSSEDNSSTSSNGTMESSGEAATASQTPSVFSPVEETAQLCGCEEKDNETCHIFHNIMHFGTRWDPSDQQQSLKDVQNSPQTDIENLLHNDWGLDFFNNHLDEPNSDESKLVFDGANNDSGSLNFECDSSAVPHSEAVSATVPGVKNASHSEAVSTTVSNVENTSNLESESKIVQNQDKYLSETSSFDYKGAIHFLWKEWNRVSDSPIYKN